MTDITALEIVTSKTKASTPLPFMVHRADEELKSRLTAPVAVKAERSPWKIEPAQEKEILTLVSDYQGEAQWLAHEVLFALMGVDKAQATVVIPFLEKDRDYNIPGLKHKLRCNFAYANTQNPELLKQFRDLLPEVPLVVANMVDGIPLRTDSVDLLVLNHGIILEELGLCAGFENVRNRNCYLEGARRIVKPGKLVLFIDARFEGAPAIEADNLARELDMEIVVFDLPQSVLATIKNKMAELPDKGQSKWLDRVYSFADLFVPWTMRENYPESKIVFFKKPTEK